MNRQDIFNEILRLYYATGANGFFEPPTLRIASANDEWFARFKSIIGDFHWTPDEALKAEFPNATPKSVICWSLPLDAKARFGNRMETAKPGVDWARARSFGEEANANMRRQLCLFLQSKGFAAVAPHLNMDFEVAHERLAGNWSERHVAFVAGMGTFGLSGGLITEHGIAQRLGSVVTDLELEPDVRPYGDDPFAWCTKCGICARRCPAGSIGKTIAERNKAKCLNYVKDVVGKNREDYYGWLGNALGCGLCQTDVPCEFTRP